MATYYVLTSPDPHADRPHSTEWPKELRVSFDAREVRLFQGTGHGLGGTAYDFDDFQADEWTAFLKACGGAWLSEELTRHDSLAELDETDFVRRLSRHAPLVTEEH
jgi:hypothetical protein